MPARSSSLVMVGLAVAAGFTSLVATGGVASAASRPSPILYVTAKQCTDGGGKVVTSVPMPSNRPEPHQAPQKRCMGGKYTMRLVSG